jgi:predicted metal-dependent phosphoesterase TrpH
VIADLHSHSTASDGELSALALLQRAQMQGVELMAITDHDTVAGYRSVRDQWQQLRSQQQGAGHTHFMQLIAGVELSCLWSKRLIHIVGLNIDTDHTALQTHLQKQQQARAERAHLIAEKLAGYGFKGAYEYVVKLAGDRQMGRPHFAKFLVEQGHVSSEKEAFKRYLGTGKAGDIKHVWPDMEEVVGWINASGGVAVIAHPLHYKMTATKLRALITDFKAAGGEALEVVNGRQTKDRTSYLTELANRFDMLASIGSDFHRPLAWCELGKIGSLPKSCRPVWSAWQ